MSDDLHQERLPVAKPGPGRVAPRCWTLPNTALRNRHARVAPSKLDEDVAGDAPPREVPAQGERERDAGIQVGAGDGAHEQDDRHNHQPGRHHGGGQADLALAVEDPAAGGDEHQEEGAEQLREEPPPLQAGIVELGLGAELEREDVPAAGAEQSKAGSAEARGPEAGSFLLWDGLLGHLHKLHREGHPAMSISRRVRSSGCG